MEWVNWSGSVRCTPARIATPRTRAELAQAIVDGPGPVRVRGAGHSFNAGTMTDGTLISLDALTRVLDADPATGPRPRRGRHPPARALARAARARAGDGEPRRHRRPVGRGRDLHRHARHRARSTRSSPARSRRSSWCWPTAPRRPSPTATSCAPRGSRWARSASSRRSRCAASRRSACATSTARSRSRTCSPSSSTAPRRSTTSSSGRSRTRTSRSRARTRPPTIRRRKRGRVSTYTSDILMDNHAFRAVNEVARRFPRTIPRLNRFASKVASQRERVGWSHAIFASPRLVRFEEMEYAVPREHAVDGAARRQGGARAPCGLVPDRAAVRGRRRHVPLARVRPRRRLRRRARVQGDGVRGAVPRGRGRDGARSAAARPGASART